MATYRGVGRTNTFAVKDVAALTAELEGTGVEVLDRGENRVTLVADSGGHGDWSTWVFDDEDCDDDDREI